MTALRVGFLGDSYRKRSFTRRYQHFFRNPKLAGGLCGKTQASTQADRDSWSVRYGALCHSPLTCTSTHVRVSLASPLHIVGHDTESEVHASGKFCSISDPPPPPLSLSLSPCDQVREKESLPLTHDNQSIQGKVR